MLTAWLGRTIVDAKLGQDSIDYAVFVAFELWRAIIGYENGEIATTQKPLAPMSRFVAVGEYKALEIADLDTSRCCASSQVIVSELTKISIGHIAAFPRSANLKCGNLKRRGYCCAFTVVAKRPTRGDRKLPPAANN